MNITFDGNNISCLNDFYKQLEPVLRAGECPWGENLDSLQEVVEMQFNYTGNPSLDITQITWLNSDKSKYSLGIPETLRWLTVKLEATTFSEHRNYLGSWMEQIKAGKSKTLFGVLVEILSSNGSIKFNQF